MEKSYQGKQNAQAAIIDLAGLGVNLVLSRDTIKQNKRTKHILQVIKGIKNNLDTSPLRLLRAQPVDPRHGIYQPYVCRNLIIKAVEFDHRLIADGYCSFYASADIKIQNACQK